MTVPWEAALVEAAARVLGVRLAVIPDRRRALLAMAQARAAATGYDDVAQWVDSLSDPVRLKAEEQAFVQVATVGFTFFDRDRGQLNALAASLGRRSRPVRIWSAGCSSGEEVWTLALALAQQELSFTLLGSDVDEARLEVARQGRYTEDRLQRLSDRERRTYFELGEAGVYTVSAALREHVSFSVHNLADQPPLAGPFDAILCRNVLMYFTPEATRRVLAGFRRSLSADGVVLFAGHEAPSDAGWGRRDDGELLAWAPTESTAPSTSRARPVLPLPSPRTPVSLRSMSESARLMQPRLTHSLKLPAPPPEAREWRGASSSAAPSPPAQLSTEESAVARLVQRACRGLAEHRWDEALDDFTAALALEPQWPELHYLIGVLHRKTGDQQSCHRALRRALFLDDQFWPAAWLLSGLLDAQADRAQADRLRSGALVDARVRPLETLFQVPEGAAWSPTVDQLMTHPYVRRWRS